MTEHKLTVDVYASWGDIPPRYRVYVDNDLLTERDFIWSGTNQFIRENIIVNLKPGEHKLQVKQINKNGTIRTENVTLNDTSISDLYFTTTE
jgi:hypothetical protein